MEKSSFKKTVLTIAALAVTAGVSFLIASSQDQPVILDRPPEIIENINPNNQPFDRDRPDSPGGISVVPTEIVVENAKPGLDLPDIVVSNNSQIKQNLEIDFVPVKRQLASGGAVTPKDAQKSSRAVELDREKMTLSPGQSKKISGKVVSSGRKMIIGAVRIKIIGNSILKLPEDKNVETAIESILEISSMVYLIFEKPDSSKISLEGITARGSANQGVRFFAMVKSENDFLTTPKGNVVVKNKNGEAVVTSDFAGDQNIFPRQKREIFTTSPVKLAPGDYEIEARVLSKGEGQLVKKPLKIATNGSPLDLGAEAFIETDQTKVKPNKSFSMSINVFNSGNQSFSPSAVIHVYKINQSEPIYTKKLEIDSVEPGSNTSGSLSIKSPSDPGVYSITADVFDSQGIFLSQSTAEMIVARQGVVEKSNFVKFRDWLSENQLRSFAAGFVFFGFFVILILAAVYLVSFLRNRRS